MMSEKMTMVEPFKRSSFNDAGIGIVLLSCQIAMICTRVCTAKQSNKYSRLQSKREFYSPLFLLARTCYTWRTL
jgi:hypothetical protein